MNCIRDITAIGVVTLAIVLVLASTSPAAALSMDYKYAGNDLGNGQHVSGRFMIDCDLTSSLDCSNLEYDDHTNAITYFSFYSEAGWGRISSEWESSPVRERFAFDTDGDANIINWDIDLAKSTCLPSSCPQGTLAWVIITKDSLETLDFSGVDTIDGLNGFYLANNPGKWNTEIVPIPAAVYLFPSGLIVLLALSRRRRSSA